MTQSEQHAYDKALQLIENLSKNGDEVAQMGGMGLTRLPPQIGQLTELKELHLESNKLATLPPEIGQLSKLTRLYLPSNQLAALPPEIGQLSKLLELYLDFNQLATLPPEIGRLSKLRQLYLPSNQLATLPPEIGELSDLTRLYLSSNQLTTLPSEIGRLFRLTRLYLDRNQLTTLPPEIGQLSNLTLLYLDSNHLVNLPPEVGQLPELTRLYLLSNHLSTLPPEIGQLSKLLELYLDSNHLTALPKEIGQLSKLTRLYLSSNRLRTLPPEIGQLSKLLELYLDFNQLSTLPPEIGGLSKLLGLRLSSNELANLPLEIGQLSKLTELDLYDNPLLQLPPSILGSKERFQQRGNTENPYNPANILEYYFSIQGVKGRPLREVKVIWVGRGEVGKSSMVDGIRGKKFIKDRKRTDGIAISPWRVRLEDGEAELLLWDFGGQEIMHGTHQFFMTHRSLYVVMVDGRHDRGRQDAEYWLKLVKAFGGSSPILVVMNRQDGHPFDVDREALAAKYSINLEHFFRTDCASAATLKPLKAAIFSAAAKMLAAEERFPASSWNVKTQLGMMKERGEDYLPEQRYQDLCAEHGVTDEEAQHKLLRRLADLGTIVSFPDDIRMSALSVLNPEWATEGIYRVVTNEELQERSQGVLTRKKLRELLPEDRWPKPIHVQYVLDLMGKFDLCFQVDGDPDRMLVPELLPDRTPPFGNWTPEECVVFQYHFSVLPHGVLPRFITRTHLLSERQNRWRTGVILVDDGAEARIQADYDSNTLNIWIRGQHTSPKRELLKVIRNNFESIHSRIEGLAPQEWIAVPGHPEVLLNYRDVILDERRGKTSFAVTVDGNRIDWRIGELLDGIESKIERQKSADDSGKGQFIKFEIQGDYIEGSKNMKHDQSITIGGNVVNSQVGQMLSNCTNLIHQQASGERKDLLEKLNLEARELINALPEDQHKKASKNLELAVRTATENEPDRAWYEVSAKGLLEASKFAKDFSGNIAGAIKALGKSVWPDFQLPGE